MAIQPAGPRRTWTVAEARARLPEVLRLAEEEGPQQIGVRKPFVLAPASAWDDRTVSPDPATPPEPDSGEPRMPFGQWLLKHMQIGVDLELPERGPDRPPPFVDDDDDNETG